MCHIFHIEWSDAVSNHSFQVVEGVGLVASGFQFFTRLAAVFSEEVGDFRYYSFRFNEIYLMATPGSFIEFTSAPLAISSSTNSL